MRPSTEDRRTKIQKLLCLAEAEKGSPEGELSRQRARTLFEDGKRIFPFEVGTRHVLNGELCQFVGETWTADEPLPVGHFQRVPRPQPQYVVVHLGSYYDNGSTFSTATSTATWWKP